MSQQKNEDLLQQLAFDERGLLPVIAQDSEDGTVLMLAYANEEALRLTLTSGRAHYFSRSRQELWRKGDGSGNLQQVIDVALDCDGDAVLYRVRQTGPACHTGERSCFYRSFATNGADASIAEAAQAPRLDTRRSDVEYGAHRLGAGLALLDKVVAQRLRELPEGSYVARLHDRGRGYIAQKVVEEAGETIVAALEGRDDELTGEAADLLFHLAVLLQESGQRMGDVVALLERRHNSRSGA